MPWLLKVISTMSTVMLVLDIYIAWRLYSTGKKYWPENYSLVSWLWIVVVIIFLAYPAHSLVTYWVCGSVDVYEKPWAVQIYLFWFGLALTGHLFGWILLADFIRHTFSAVKKLQKKWFKWGYMLLFIVVTLYTIFQLFTDTTQINVKYVQKNIQNLPASLNGVKIVHISDVQADRFTDSEKIARYVNKINAQQPDLVLFSGDLVSWGQNYIETGAIGLGKIDSKYGVYAVLGDHDYWAGADSIESALEMNGVNLLNNENHWISIGNDTLKITGITQVYDRRISLAAFNQLLDQEPGADVEILVTHQINQQLLGRVENRQYNMVLAGHTHGGQFAPALLFIPVSAPMLETDFVSGIYYQADMLINICNGLGFTLAPVRLHAPIELTVLELQPG